jgi:peptidoglycan-N-acetylglucosamine deacetylase
MKNTATVSIDVDSLSSIYKGNGLKRQEGYTFIELRTGFETIQHFFDQYKIKTTLFLVGNDFLHQPNHSSIRSIMEEGHELANHSMTHPQGFRWLNKNVKEKEINDMGEICKKVTGVSPIGFRSPGWNIDNGTLPILLDLGYTYDSSIFPTSLMPLMKLAHWVSMSRQEKPNRTTMGMWRYMAAPITPYNTSQNSFANKGEGGLIEFPVSVTPILHIPFFATLLLFIGNKFYEAFYQSIRLFNLPVHFQMHLSDFVDYSLPELRNQMPSPHRGTYVPQAIGTPLKRKLDVFRRMMDLMVDDYDFMTLKEWSGKIKGKS